MEEEDEYVPPSASKPKIRPLPKENGGGVTGKRRRSSEDSDEDTEQDGDVSSRNASPRPQPKPSGIPRHNVFLSQDDSLDEPAIVPNRKIKKDTEAAGAKAYVPDVGEAGAVKKKKR